MSSHDSKYFSTTKKGEIPELKEELNSQYKDKRKDVKKMIVVMAVGKNVSSLFTDVVNCMQTENVELKKLVYLYLINYAKSQPDLAILAINTFVKDSQDPNPLIRDLDDNPYVCKTTTICVAKLYEINIELVEDRGFLNALKGLISENNPLVAANVVTALTKIQESSSKPIFEITSHTLSKLLTALNESKDVVLAEKPVISDDSNQLDPTLLEKLLSNIATLSSVYHKPPEAFITHGKTTQKTEDEEYADAGELWKGASSMPWVKTLLWSSLSTGDPEQGVKPNLAGDPWELLFDCVDHVVTTSWCHGCRASSVASRTTSLEAKVVLNTGEAKTRAKGLKNIEIGQVKGETDMAQLHSHEKFKMVTKPEDYLKLWWDYMGTEERKIVRTHIGHLPSLIEMDAWPKMIHVLTTFWDDQNMRKETPDKNILVPDVWDRQKIKEAFLNDDDTWLGERDRATITFRELYRRFGRFNFFHKFGHKLESEAKWKETRAFAFVVGLLGTMVFPQGENGTIHPRVVTVTHALFFGMEYNSTKVFHNLAPMIVADIYLALGRCHV
ncbi:Beta-adaptin-like protein C [Capsicum annuum]|nr:Beta-adaptin-like protein C [Capsicum annuum]